MYQVGFEMDVRGIDLSKKPHIHTAQFGHLRRRIEFVLLHPNSQITLSGCKAKKISCTVRSSISVLISTLLFHKSYFKSVISTLILQLISLVLLPLPYVRSAFPLKLRFVSLISRCVKISLISVTLLSSILLLVLVAILLFPRIYGVGDILPV